MPSSSVEDYVKQLYMEQQRTQERLVPLGRLAKLMNVVPGTATTMVKALADAGLVQYEPRTGVCLSPGGEKLALHVLRRHRLVEELLVKVLHLDWSEVHEEAEIMEHVISEKVLDRIDQLLGHPTVDPHGDPIPTASGTMSVETVQEVSAKLIGKQVKISRIATQDPQFLSFAQQHGLVPGTLLRVAAYDSAADAWSLEVADRPTLVVGSAAIGKLQVIVVNHADGV